MAKDSVPVTPAIRALRAAKVPFGTHLYQYEERGGTAASSRKLGVPEHNVVKTLVFKDESGAPCIVLMHGDCQVSTKELARQIGCRSIAAATPERAMKHTGYLTGGTSPFGMKHSIAVYCESTILELDQLYINGGKRGFLVSITPEVLKMLITPITVQVAIGPA